MMEGNRKLVAAGVALLAGLVTVVLKGDVPANFLHLIEAALGAFIAGNAVEHAASAAVARAEAATGAPVGDLTALPEAPAPAPVDLTPVIEGQASLIQASTLTQQGTAAVLDRLNFIIQRTGLDKQA